MVWSFQWTVKWLWLKRVKFRCWFSGIFFSFSILVIAVSQTWLINSNLGNSEDILRILLITTHYFLWYVWNQLDKQTDLCTSKTINGHWYILIHNYSKHKGSVIQTEFSQCLTNCILSHFHFTNCFYLNTITHLSWTFSW